MARYTGPVCKLCRREGEKLFLKGERCYSTKCSVDRRNYAPGHHGKSRRFKQSSYGIQLREKQKIKRTYGILERQFHLFYERALRARGITGEQLLIKLESRLDTVVFRLGMAPSLSAARQLVTHGHFEVNSKSVNVPSYQVKPGDVVKVCEKSRRLEIIHESMRRAKAGSSVPYLELDKARMAGSYVRQPMRSEIPVTAREQLVIELYSR